MHNEVDSWGFVADLSEDEKVRFFGGKTKAALFDAGMLSPEDYFKPLQEIDLSGVVIPDSTAMHHSMDGDFIQPSVKYPNGRLSGGGHAFGTIAELNRRGIGYNVVRTAPNGVVFGNVPTHPEPFKAIGQGQAWFPGTWTQQDILSAGIAAANRGVSVSSYAKEFIHKGVNVRAIVSGGRIHSIFPSYDQPQR